MRACSQKVSKMLFWAFVFIATLFFVLGGSTAYAQTPSRVVKIGASELYYFMELDENGKFIGILPDYLEEMAKYANWELVYVPCGVGDALEYLKSGKVDIVGGLLDNEYTSTDFDLSSQNIGFSKATLVANADSVNFTPMYYSSFNGMRVGSNSKSAALRRSLDEFAQNNSIRFIQKLYEGNDLLYEALANGEIDAVLTKDTSVRQGQLILAEFGEEPYYFAVKKGNAELLLQVNESLAKMFQVNPYFSYGIYQKYFASVKSVRGNLSKSELQYVQETKSVNIAINADYAPVSYVDKNGNFFGVAADTLTYITQKTGLSFNYIFTTSTAETVDALKTNKADIAIDQGLSNPSIYDEYFIKSTPFYMGLGSIVTNTSKPLQSTGLVIALIEGANPKLSSDISVKYYQTLDDCLAAVSSGVADLTFADANVLNLKDLDNNYTDLKYEPSNEENFEVPFVLIKPANSELLMILEKTLQNMPENFYLDSLNNNLKTNFTNPFSLKDYIKTNPEAALSLFLSIIVSVLVVFFVIYYVQRKSKSGMEKSAKEYDALVNNIQGGISTIYRNEIDFTVKPVYISEGWVELTGFTLDEVNELFYGDPCGVILSEDRLRADREFANQIAAADKYKVEYRLLRKDGKIVWVVDKGSIERRANGEFITQSIIVDITAQKEKDIQIAEQEQLLRTSIANADIAILEYRIKDKRFEAAINTNAIFGLDADAMLQMLCGDGDTTIEQVFSFFVHPEDLENVIAKSEATLISGNSVFNARLKNLSADYVWCRLNVTVLRDNGGEPYRAIINVTNINDLKQANENLKHEVLRDPLTGFYNKQAIPKLMGEMLCTNCDSINALCAIDIDNFKQVNDTKGHLFGDEVIVKISQCIQDEFSANSILGRMGGDEFVVLIHNLPNKDALYGKLDNLCETIGNSFLGVEGLQKVTCSIGVAFSDGIAEFNKLFQNADKALYSTKATGKDGYKIYTGNETISTTGGKRLIAQSNFCDLNKRVLECMCNGKSVMEAVYTALELVGAAFNADRIYIIEQDFRKNTLHQTLNWCPVGESDTDISNLNPNLLQTFASSDIVLCGGRERANLDLLSQISKKGTEVAMLILIGNQGDAKGVLGLDFSLEAYDALFKDISSLSHICKALGAFMFNGNDALHIKSEMEKFRNVLDNMPSIMYAVDENYQIIYQNKLLQDLFPGDITTCHERYNGVNSPCIDCPIDNNGWVDIYCKPLGKWFQAKNASVELDNRPCNIINAFEITDSRDKILMLEQKAYVDELTGLPTFGKFKHILRDKLLTAAPSEYALLSFGIDDFDFINRSTSFEKGNKLLQAIANSTTAAFNKGAICSRVYKDHFIVIAKTALLSKEFLMQGSQVPLFDALENDPDFTLPTRMSIGVYVVDDPNASICQIFDCANIAHAKAKTIQTDKPCAVVYNYSILKI